MRPGIRRAACTHRSFIHIGIVILILRRAEQGFVLISCCRANFRIVVLILLQQIWRVIRLGAPATHTYARAIYNINSVDAAAAENINSN